MDKTSAFTYFVIGQLYIIFLWACNNDV